MYIPMLPPITLNQMVRLPKDIFVPERTVGCFGRAREAIYHALCALNIAKGKNILVPASLCIDALEPFLYAGMYIRYYQLDERLNFDIEDIKSRIDENTVAICIIHYFGFAKSLEAINSLCMEQGLILIEDCAHCLAHPVENMKVANIGRLAIFSPWKFLPVPDGGVLIDNAQEISINRSNAYNSNQEHIRMFSRLVKLIVNSGRINLPIFCYRKKMEIYEEESDPAQPIMEIHKKFPIRPMSSITKKLMQHIDYEYVVQSRRDNYIRCLELSRHYKLGSALYPELPEKVVPYNFPILVNNPSKLQKQLRCYGLAAEISVNRAFTHHPNIMHATERFAVVEHLSAHVLSLPIHQAIEKRHWGRIELIFKSIQ